MQRPRKVPRRRSFLSLSAAAIGITLLVYACELFPRGGDRHGVILISIDTLRPDHLGCYGYPRNTTPALDRFRQDAVLFRQAIAHAPSTLSSHASILTSLLPNHHGASIARGTGLAPDIITLAEVLKANGYATASFNGGAQLAPVYGLRRGFDIYSSAHPSETRDEVLFDPLDEFDNVVNEAIEWIESTRPEKFFLFLHSYEVHHPYTPDEAILAGFEPSYSGPLPNAISVELIRQINTGVLEIDEADLQHVINCYDAEILSVDESFLRLVEFLRQEGLYESSVIVFTSDHGEEFGEHGWVGWHAHTLYDELLKVPLLVKLPRSRHAGLTVERQVRGIDIAPSLLWVLGIESPASFEGANMLARMEAEGPRLTYAVSFKDWVPPEDLVSIRTEEWKYVQEQLYDLRSDAREKLDVSGRYPHVIEALERNLEDLLASRPIPEPYRVKTDEELLERLRSLGYVR